MLVLFQDPSLSAIYPVRVFFLYLLLRISPCYVMLAASKFELEEARAPSLTVALKDSFGSR